MEGFAKPGDFCPNEACPDYGKLQDGQEQHNIIKTGHTQRGVQRYECNTCHLEGGNDGAMVEVYGLVPEYRGRGRLPTRKKPGSDWLYLQMVKQRDEHGRF